MQLALELWFYKGTVNFIIELVREGLKNKKNKKYGIFHNRAGGVYPIPHFFIYLFSDSIK